MLCLGEISDIPPLFPFPAPSDNPADIRVPGQHNVAPAIMLLRTCDWSEQHCGPGKRIISCGSVAFFFSCESRPLPLAGGNGDNDLDLPRGFCSGDSGVLFVPRNRCRHRKTNMHDTRSVLTDPPPCNLSSKQCGEWTTPALLITLPSFF